MSPARTYRSRLRSDKYIHSRTASPTTWRPGSRAGDLAAAQVGAGVMVDD